MFTFNTEVHQSIEKISLILSLTQPGHTRFAGRFHHSWPYASADARWAQLGRPYYADRRLLWFDGKREDYKKIHRFSFAVNFAYFDARRVCWNQCDSCHQGGDVWRLLESCSRCTSRLSHLQNRPGESLLHLQAGRGRMYGKGDLWASGCQGTFFD